MPSTPASEYSYATTMQSMRNQVGSKVRNMTHYGQPTIEIHLDGTDGPRNTWVTSYSTMDTISGFVAVKAQHDTRFEDIDIAFVGSCLTFVDTLTTTPSMTGRTEANHRFLVLRQPMDEADFPTPRVFEAGRTYKFNFTFTVPDRLLPKSCTHKVSSDHVRDCHLALPPSIGDPDLAGFGTTLLDDFAPEMAKIQYCVKVRIAHQRGTDGISILGEKSKKVRVKPALIEQPPLNIEGRGNNEYRPKQEKTVRKGFFKGKLGTLSATSFQPKALVIPGARTSENAPITTMAKLLLRFDPSDEEHSPPRLGSLSTKLKVSTFYASSPRHNLPTRMTIGFDISQGAYSENVALSTLCIASAQWEQHSSASNPSEDVLRRDSGISDCSHASSNGATFTAGGILPASRDYKNGTFYTAYVSVPITLPSNKNFIPTFHSCLVSRIYTLGLAFTVHGSTSIHLKVPIQICANGSESGIENARARSIEETEFRAQTDMWSPRSVAPPPSFEDVQGTRRRSSVVRDELPPDYTAFAAPVGRFGTMVA